MMVWFEPVMSGSFPEFLSGHSKKFTRSLKLPIKLNVNYTSFYLQLGLVYDRGQMKWYYYFQA